MERYRRLAFAGMSAVCLLLCGIFIWSWINNRQLLGELQSAGTARINPAANPPSLQDLDSLERLRLQIIRLEGGLPGSYHWGLYSGDRALPYARAAYFRRFQRVLLVYLNGLMTADLAALPAAPDTNAPYDPVYRILKTHLIITSGQCTVDSALVSRVLKDYRGRLAPGAASDWQSLADRQIDFYASELPNGNPARLPEDILARDRARQYLQNLKGVDRLYAAILANTEKQVTKVNRLRDLAANYTQVLSGPGEVSAAFSKDGWTYFEKASKESNSGALGEACVVGQTAGVIGTWKQNAETADAIKRMFISDYIQRWRKFVAGFAVLRYNGPQDASRKLEILADHKSPLLAVLALAANETNFPPPNVADGNVVQKSVNKLFGSLKKVEGEAKVATATPDENGENPSTPSDITRFFQPVHWVEPPGSETWVVDKNAAYIDALSQFGHSMQDIAQTQRNADPQIYQTASQNYQKGLETVQQIAKGFKPVGVGGLDTSVETLLEEPFRLASSYIKTPDPGKEVNAGLRSFCTSERPTFRKFPFVTTNGDDVSLTELTNLIQPATGALWKFQQQSLADLVVKDGTQWKAKDPGKKPQVTPELLAFLNRGQALADVFYSGGATQPQFSYTFRPKLDASLKDSILELEIDGKVYAWTTGLQKQFTWPAPPGTKDPKAVARIRTPGPVFAFASRSGIWAIFRILADAEPRDLGSKSVEWKYTSGGVGTREPLQPAPVQMEIVNFPGGVDVFNPKFWAGFECPSAAVQ